MTSSINKKMCAPLYMAYMALFGLLLSSCASLSPRAACNIGGQAATKPPPWINKTAFELNLPKDYYYGKGASSNIEGLPQRRKDALAAAYADIAQRVSVRIFSRQVVLETTKEIRAEAVAKAITDLNASGIEAISEWHDKTSCTFHVFTRVPEKVARGWKSAAQSHLVERPGLGLVRRAAEDLYHLRYREIGRPTMMFQWKEEKSLQKFAPRANAIFQDAMRRHFKKYGINQFTAQRSAAKIVIMLNVSSVSKETFIVQASLREVKRNKKGRGEIAAAISEGDYRRARPAPSFALGRDGGFEAARPTRSAYIRQIARELTFSLIGDWLDNEETTRR